MFAEDLDPPQSLTSLSHLISTVSAVTHQKQIMLSDIVHVREVVPLPTPQFDDSEQTLCCLIGSSPAAGGVWYFHFASLSKYCVLFGAWAELEAHGVPPEEVGIVSVH